MGGRGRGQRNITDNFGGDLKNFGSTIGPEGRGRDLLHWKKLLNHRRRSVPIVQKHGI